MLLGCRLSLAMRATWVRVSESLGGGGGTVVVVVSTTVVGGMVVGALFDSAAQALTKTRQVRPSARLNHMGQG
jgi:hypothetical protein